MIADWIICYKLKIIDIHSGLEPERPCCQRILSLLSYHQGQWFLGHFFKENKILGTNNMVLVK
ncbi:uncharacterized protein METZ01_LOCUS160312 [marine metagenome]|jgi:hypothetical protein|uniref:Uncharacterized protein n=1 Tax=marine metagenome TaxID=408172 RepID=A0A382B159_9ZZZZ